MTDPRWLSQKVIELIQKSVINKGGGSHGLKDIGLLQSALARPQNQYAYGETDTFQLAAGYAEGISRNHAFIDGNKRTAFQAADIFLTINGYHLNQSNGSEYADMMVELGQGKVSREDVAKILKDNSRPIHKGKGK
ncbi:MAG: type II toxin-antitoxin system death-on-curing family toxin [Rhizobiales bacterium]|nr:type II toxin-antitoxin system death-on-curing family toxin [Hyphomicrobiales bacterium]